MNYKEIKDLLIKESDNGNYSSVIKGIIAYEKGIDDEEMLDKIYDRYMEIDGYTLFNMEDIIEDIEEFDENEEDE